MNQAVQAILQDASVVNAAIFCAAATVGQVFHAVKKWSEGYQWLMANPRATVGAVLANIVGMAGFISTGALDNVPKIGTVVALGIFMGFSADSALNKGQKEIWTDEQRKDKVGP